MKLNASAAADVLKTLIQEDRAEARIYRDRVQNVTSTLTVASFAISSFLIGSFSRMDADQLQYITLLMDLGLVTVMLIFFLRLKLDLVHLRKAMTARQDLLKDLDEGKVSDIDPFPDTRKKGVKPPDITDNDLDWVVGLSVVVVLTKMLVLWVYAGSFVAGHS